MMNFSNLDNSRTGRTHGERLAITANENRFILGLVDGERTDADIAAIARLAGLSGFRARLILRRLTRLGDIA